LPQTKKYQLTVKDDGMGFDGKANLKQGNGLRNMKSRAKSLKGNIIIESGIGEGTNVHLTF
jgi:signal transduction histidine kinase